MAQESISSPVSAQELIEAGEIAQIEIATLMAALGNTSGSKEDQVDALARLKALVDDLARRWH